MKRSRALISVYEKKALNDLAHALNQAGYELVSSGGTARHLESLGLPVTPVESVTGNPEAFEGRMKTLSFQIESAILFDRNNAEHRREAESLGLVPIDVVVCNFYPFEKAHREDLPMEKAIELIDIGGPTMVRAAAKNFQHVAVLADPADYALVLPSLRQKKPIPAEVRLELAAKAFEMTARYESRIDAYFQARAGKPALHLFLRDGKKLRYGENPQQEGCVYWSSDKRPFSLMDLVQRTGKELSFNNYLDVDAALRTLAHLGGEQPACVIVKHANPCGAGRSGSIEQAFLTAWEGDPLAAFGGIVALNRPLGLALADRFLAEKKFVEIFAAPDVEEQALSILSEKKKNLTVLTHPGLGALLPCHEQDVKKICGGFLVQEADRHRVSPETCDVVSTRPPTEAEWTDLLFAWKVGRESKSNSIILARDQQLVGSGVGQQDRLRACRLAVEKAREKARGASAASDGFFPFPDGPALLIEAGVTAMLHPGGSIRDQETIDLCNARRIALVTTRGVRAFKH